jgi:hypothetical protein
VKSRKAKGNFIKAARRSRADDQLDVDAGMHMTDLAWTSLRSTASRLAASKLTKAPTKSRRTARPPGLRMDGIDQDAGTEIGDERMIAQTSSEAKPKRNTP